MGVGPVSERGREYFPIRSLKNALYRRSVTYLVYRVLISERSRKSMNGYQHLEDLRQNQEIRNFRLSNNREEEATRGRRFRLLGSRTLSQHSCMSCNESAARDEMLTGTRSYIER